MASNGIFDITTPDQFFGSIRSAFKRYESPKAKPAEDLLYVIMGLNHLREWIAPGYDHKNPAHDEAQKFYNLIFDVHSYKTIKEISNRSKHLLKRTEFETSSNYGLTIDEWDIDIDSVKDFDLGPASVACPQ